jgi:hypothetical protein
MLGNNYSPGSVNLMGRSLSVIIQSFLIDRPLKDKETSAQRRRALTTLVEFTRSLAKSVRNKLAQVGPGEGLTAEHIVNLDPPLTLPQILAGVPAWRTKMQNLAKKISQLNDRAPMENRAYMKYLLGRERAALLGFLFVIQTSNRIGTAQNLTLKRNLVLTEQNGEEVCVFVPVGASATKVETALRKSGKRGGRMSRQFFVARKLLSPSFSKELKRYVEEDLPNIVHYLNTYKGQEIIPESPNGQLSLFKFWSSDVFRKAVDKVGKANNTDIRAAIESAVIKALKTCRHL